MARPRHQVPVWADDATYVLPSPVAGQPTKSEPAAGIISQGHTPGGRPPAQFENWIKNILSDFVKHNDRRSTTFPLHNLASVTALGTAAEPSPSAIVIYADDPDGGYWTTFTSFISGIDEFHRSYNGLTWRSFSSAGYPGVDGAYQNGVFLHAAGSSGVQWATAPQTPAGFTGAVGLPAGTYNTIFAGGTVVLASATNGSLWRSLDDGVNFAAVSGPPSDWETSNYHAAQFVRNPVTGRILAVPSSGSRFIHSDDDGDTWTEVNVTNANWRGVAYLNGSLYAINNAAGNQVWRSSNDGASWVQLSPNLTGVVFIRKMFAHENLLVACRSNSGRLMYSEDGATWYAGTSIAPDETSVSATPDDWSYGGGRFASICYDTAGSFLILTQATPEPAAFA